MTRPCSGGAGSLGASASPRIDGIPAPFDSYGQLPQLVDGFYQTEGGLPGEHRRALRRRAAAFLDAPSRAAPRMRSAAYLDLLADGNRMQSESRGDSLRAVLRPDAYDSDDEAPGCVADLEREAYASCRRSLATCTMGGPCAPRAGSLRQARRSLGLGPLSCFRRRCRKRLLTPCRTPAPCRRQPPGSQAAPARINICYLELSPGPA